MYDREVRLREGLPVAGLVLLLEAQPPLGAIGEPPVGQISGDGGAECGKPGTECSGGEKSHGRRAQGGVPLLAC